MTKDRVAAYRAAQEDEATSRSLWGTWLRSAVLIISALPGAWATWWVPEPWKWAVGALGAYVVIVTALLILAFGDFE
jgi:hypothetical protein